MLPFCIKRLKNQHRTMSIQQSPSESPGPPCPGQHRAGSGQGTISGEAPAHTTHKGNGDTILPKTVTLQHFLGASQGTSRPVSCSILGHVLPPSMAKLILTLLPPVHMEHHQLPVPVGVLLCVQWARSSCQKKKFFWSDSIKPGGQSRASDGAPELRESARRFFRGQRAGKQKTRPSGKLGHTRAAGLTAKTGWIPSGLISFPF